MRVTKSETWKERELQSERKLFELEISEGRYSAWVQNVAKDVYD